MDKNNLPKPDFKNPLVKWIDSRLPVFSYVHYEYIYFPMPRNVNYFWSFGGIAMVILLLMIVTGILLASQYTANADLAFGSVERIMRDVNGGWLMRYMHANGASMFFIAVYIHMFRAFYYGSYKAPRELTWILGLVIFLIMMATAFMGYVLPWGQQSFWAATVIVNLFGAIPVVGDQIVTWLLGGYSVDNPTLNRFFALHFLLPFVLLGIVMLHVVSVHITGSNNPTGIDVKSPQDTVRFHPYTTSKDLFAIGVFALLFASFVFYAPNYLGHPDNYVEANPLSTPAHIVPEWYFLPFYAILRSIPDKLAGVIAMFGAIAVLFILPWLDRAKVRSCRYRPLYRIFLFLFVADAILLGWLGAKPAEAPYVLIAQLATFYYFLHFLVIVPVISSREKPKALPESIAQSVLKS